MSKSKLNLPPPFLKGVYLREEFDFEARGSAVDTQDVASEPAPAETNEPLSSVYLSDDDFLNSLLTVSDEPIGEFGGEAAIADSSTDAGSDQADGSEAVPAFVAPPRQADIDDKPRKARFPFSIPWVAGFDLQFKTAVTFLVGENGSGKSTLIEALASMCGYPVCGGGKNDLPNQFGPERESELAEAMYAHFVKRPRDGYFFRAEFYAQFATLLDQRAHDPDFNRDPYTRYGGQSPHTRSHGEAFLDLLNNRLGSGLFLMDEPESALSPQRQLSFMAIMADRVQREKTQFVVATHSPILMTFPGATILSLDSEKIEEVTLEETSHFQLTQGILDHPEKYWRHLLEDLDGEEG